MAGSWLVGFFATEHSPSHDRKALRDLRIVEVIIVEILRFRKYRKYTIVAKFGIQEEVCKMGHTKVSKPLARSGRSSHQIWPQHGIRMTSVIFEPTH